MKIKSLLAVAAASAAVASASAFEWQPAFQQPNPSAEVTNSFALKTLIFNCQNVEGVAMTDVMPIWIDEEGNEIAATSGVQDPWNWDSTEFNYSFDISAFKSNGEYTLRFPEGLLVNGAGEKSDKVDSYFTVKIPELVPPMFEDFEILSISPDFSEPQGLWDDQEVKVNTNHNDAIGYTDLQIFDNTTGEGIVFSNNYSTERTLGNASEITWTVAGNYKFFEDHQYTAEFIFYNGTDAWGENGATPVVSRQKYTFTGKVEGYKYSSVELLGVTPEPWSAINEASQAVFTYTFSAPVTVYKAASPKGQFGMEEYPESCLSSNEDKTVWTLDLSDNEYVKSVDAELVIYIYARDMDGSQLQGDFGEEDNSCFSYTWQCDLGAFPIVVTSPENGSTLDSINDVVVKSESGEPMTYNWGDAYIKNSLGETIGLLIYEQPEGSDGSAATEFHFTKWIVGDSWDAEPLEIVKEGSYEIYFSTGCFVMGEEFSSINSKSLTSTFNVGDGSAVEAVNAASVCDVYDMQGRVVLRNASSADVKALSKGIYVVGGRKLIIK